MKSVFLLERILLLAAQLSADGEEGAGLEKALIAQHHYLLALLRFKTNDDALAEDILQETYLAFLGSAPDRSRFADETKLKNYLVTIALNKLRDHWRKEGVVRRHQALFRNQDEADAWLEHLPSAQAGPDGRFLDAEESARLRRAVALAMEGLGDRHRLVLELKFAKDLDNGKIAEALGLGVKAVESLLFRAKAQFRKEFEKTLTEENESAPERVDYKRDAAHGTP
jgi:RNA polymerase sigma factor (sigma-70 family)